MHVCRKARFVKEPSCSPSELEMYELDTPPVLITRKDGKYDSRDPTQNELHGQEEYHEKYSNVRIKILDGSEDMDFMWGRTPALDILNLAANEGLDYTQPLLLNFRGT